MKNCLLSDPPAPGVAPPPGAPRRVVGLDVHPDTCDAVILRPGGSAAAATVERSHGGIPTGDLAAWAAANLDPATDLLVMEACANSFDLAGRLAENGFGALVLESGQVGKLADAFVDDDRLAAERVARAHLTGMAKAVWIPDGKTRERRELLHAYTGAVVDHTRATNELKGYLTGFNIRLKERSPAKEETRSWIRRNLPMTPLRGEILEGLFANLDHAAACRKRLYARICAEMAGEKDMLGCLRVAGIGVANAFAIVATVGDIGRFAHAGKLVSYLGLNPGRKKSGRGKDIKVGVGNRGRKEMRRLLMQGAHAVLRKGGRGNNPLAKWGFKLFARKGNRNIAVAAITRKLARALYYILSGRAVNIEEQAAPLERKLRGVCAKITKQERGIIGLAPSTAQIVSGWLRQLGITKPEIAT